MGKKKPEDTPLDPLLASRIEQIMAKASTPLDPDEKERVRIALRALAPIADKAGDVISDLKDLLSGETDSDDTDGDEGDESNGGDDTTPPKKKAPAKPVQTAKSAEDKKSEENTMEESEIDIAKSLDGISDPALRTAVELMLKKNAENEKEKEIALAKAAKLEEEKQVSEFMGKAAQFKNLNIDGLGEMMRQVFIALPDMYPKFEEMLRANDTIVAKSAMFGEKGRNPHNPTSEVDEEIENIANEAMVKSDGKLSKTTARAKAWTPERYQRYLNEQQKVA